MRRTVQVGYATFIPSPATYLASPRGLPAFRPIPEPVANLYNNLKITKLWKKKL
nr:MAG TPA: hypothetical protein [Caudoviricetes sp.]